MSDSEVPANCVELCLERIQDQYPRYLRGGNKPTCLRSLCSDSLEQQLGDLNIYFTPTRSANSCLDSEVRFHARNYGQLQRFF